MNAKNFGSIRVVALIGTLAASAVHGTDAAAQEAITLESMGAVRFSSSARPREANADAPRSASTVDIAPEPIMLERIGAVRMGRPGSGTTASDEKGAVERPLATRAAADASAREVFATAETTRGVEPMSTRSGR